MIVLGLSGLPNAQTHLRQTPQSLSALDGRICQGLDSSACLLINGRLTSAAAEERFTGDKGTGALPINAIEYCLREAGVTPSEVQAIAHGFDYGAYRRFFAGRRDYFEKVLSSATLISALTDIGWSKVAERFHPVEHHNAHAASAFYPSGLSEALCIVSDGMGEVDSLSIYNARDGKLQRVYRQRISDSLGLLYSICTRFLGFVFNSDEYKVMGLAAYGDPAIYRPLFQELCRFDASSGQTTVRWPRDALTRAEEGYPVAMEFLREATGFPKRAIDTPLDDSHCNFAAALQERLESLLESIAGFWLAKTSHRNLCLAGGTFLNCKANERLCNLPDVQNVFVQPASSDDGTSLGAALSVAFGIGDNCRWQRPFDPYTGPRYTGSDVQFALAALGPESGASWKWVGLTDEYFAAAANDLADDLIIAWFHGRMEFGPRALGNRSILGLPRGDRIKERINSAVKFREGFRPFAPALLEQDCDALFHSRKLAPTRYMLATARATELGKSVASGVVHEDGSARIQIVDEEMNPTFHRLLTSVKAATGYSCTVNTSFNIKGQPLIMKPLTAIETFLKTGLDKLYIEGYVIWKT